MIKLLAKKRKTHVLSGREHAVPPDLRGAKKLLRLISRPLTRGRRQELTEDTSLTQATQGRLQSLSTRARTKRTLSAEVTTPTTSRQGVYNIDNRRIISYLRVKVKRKRKKISKIRRNFFNFLKKAIDKRAFS